MSAERRVNIGMIGAGWWPDTMHLPALATCAPANIVAICDIIPERATALAQQYGIPHTFTNHNDLLDSGLCEAVIIAIDNDAHYPVTMGVLDHGLHVMCEKPLALNYAEAAEMAGLAKQKGLITGPATGPSACWRCPTSTGATSAASVQSRHGRMCSARKAAWCTSSSTRSRAASR